MMLQEPPAPPLLTRAFHLREKFAYTVNFESTGAGGSTRLQFTANLMTTKLPKGDKPAMMDCLFRDADGVINDIPVRLKLLASTAWEMQSTGIPLVSLAGPGGQHFISMLSLYIPDGAKPATSFAMDKIPLGDGLELTGRGFASRPTEGEQKFTWEADLGGREFRTGHVSMKTVFSIKDGMPLTAEGKFVAPDGTVTFKLERKVNLAARM